MVIRVAVEGPPRNEASILSDEIRFSVKSITVFRFVNGTPSANITLPSRMVDVPLTFKVLGLRSGSCKSTLMSTWPPVGVTGNASGRFPLAINGP